MERIFYRFQKMVDRGVLPYPMVFDRTRKELREFQRWVVTGLYRAIPFSDYKVEYRSKPKPEPGVTLLDLAEELSR